MNNRIIILTTIVFFLISGIFLSAVERKQADLNSKNIWMLYFADPKSDSLDFTLENHSKSLNFHWTVLSDKTTLREGDITISNGQTKTIPLSIADTQNKKITVSVTDANNNKKEIYKNL